LSKINFINSLGDAIDFIRIEIMAGTVNVKKKLSVGIITAMVVFGLFLGGYNILAFEKSKEQNLTIYNIAYDINKSLGYTVHILENDKYIPYLVLTKNYDGNVLILRQDLLNETIIFNDYYAYYQGSFMDSYLNEIFFTQLSEDTQKIVCNTEIEISARSSLGVCGQEVEKYITKIFLLSYTELGFEGSTQACIEGVKLKYFDDDVNRRIAYNNGESYSWWLRSSYNWYDCSAYGISPEGVVGGGGAYEVNCVRPAFCLPPTTSIIKKNIEDRLVYVII
jgi:hypothetical protein